MRRLLFLLPLLVRAALAAAPDSKLPDGLDEARGHYLESRNFSKALELFDSLTRKYPKDAGLWIERAQVAYLSQDKKLALSSLSRAEKLKTSASQRHDIALLYQNLQKYDKTKKALQQLMREEPKKASYARDAGICEYLMGRPDASIELLRKAIKLDPELLSAYLSLGAIYAQKGQKEEALKIFNKALAQKVSDEAELRYRTAILETKKELLKAAPAR